MGENYSSLLNTTKTTINFLKWPEKMSISKEKYLSNLSIIPAKKMHLCL